MLKSPPTLKRSWKQASCARTAHGVKLLSKGALKAKLNISVDTASKTAIEAVEKAGGKVAT